MAGGPAAGAEGLATGGAAAVLETSAARTIWDAASRTSYLSRGARHATVLLAGVGLIASGLGVILLRIVLGHIVVSSSLEFPPRVFDRSVPTGQADPPK